jgi:hypothetical protein
MEKAWRMQAATPAANKDCAFSNKKMKNNLSIHVEST